MSAKRLSSPQGGEGKKNAMDVLMKRARRSAVSGKQEDEVIVIHDDDQLDDSTFQRNSKKRISTDVFQVLMSKNPSVSPPSTSIISRVPGLSLHPQVIYNPRELIDLLSQTSGWTPVGSATDSRRVLQFGYDYSYSGVNAEIKKSNNPIPDFLQPLRNQARDLTGVEFDQCLVNRYLPGQGISRHIDRLMFGDTIACFSLGSSAVIVFRHPESGESIDVTIPENSLYIMQGDARYVWTHEMPGRLKDNGKPRGTRYSVTFRVAIPERVVT